VLHAANEREINDAFATLAELRIRALVIGNDAFFSSRRDQLASLSVRHAIPAIFEFREFAAAGGLLSYGSSDADAYRLMAIYTSRILRGEKPADLPVQQATKFELFINLKTANALGVTVPLTLLGRADEVFE
jgi:putative ABC transport system substrate-binding protein